MTGDKRTQSDKFKDAAKERSCDPDEARWEDRLKKVARPRPKAVQPDD